MVKRREPKASIKPKYTAEEIDRFISSADGGSTEETHLELNPNAKRDFKAIRVGFNQYEYKKLESLAEKTGRTKLNAIRWAIMQLAENPNLDA